ncbi:17300_t:CDS:2 [Cetraspora pellucida]|uniref:17300_t:CDS:1 n=1 Tax=Cetraspora pellucida TaxID=1433469 RepID=A0A9N9EIU2_9GLOM|nr:17300_t:CDS:2 [Cetraspora pellucida]
MSTSDRIKKAIEINDSIVYAGSKIGVAKGALNALGMVGDALRYDNECLEHDLAEMNEFMQQIKGGVDDNQKKLNMIYQEIVSIQTHMQQSERKSLDSKINAPKIDPNQLQKPELSEENKQRPSHPRIIKRIYLRNLTEVACKINDKAKPKLANFKFARMLEGDSSNLEDILNVIHWLAPEKMFEHKSDNNKNYKRPYTQKCEIFSFGMLLWELCFERVPYANKGMDDIISWVTTGGREKIPVCKGDEKDKEIQKEFVTIIKMAWQHDQEARINISKLFVMLSKMASKHVIPGAPTYLLPNKTIDYGHQSDSLLSEDKEFYLSDEDEQTEEKENFLSIEEGIRRHNLKTLEDRKIAWKIFDVNAERGDYAAMRWKGIYLWEGYHIDNRTDEQIKDDRNKALELFKLTADYGIPDSQMRYAFALKELGLLKEKEDRDEFIKYLKMSADNGNAAAMFNIADIYVNGKLKYQKDTKPE